MQQFERYQYKYAATTTLRKPKHMNNTRDTSTITRQPRHSENRNIRTTPEIPVQSCGNHDTQKNRNIRTPEIPVQSRGNHDTQKNRNIRTTLEIIYDYTATTTLKKPEHTNNTRDISTITRQLRHSENRNMRKTLEIPARLRRKHDAPLGYKNHSTTLQQRIRINRQERLDTSAYPASTGRHQY